MTNATSVASANAPANSDAKTMDAKTMADDKQTLLNDIGHKWNQFTSPELHALKDNAELVKGVVAKYGTDQAVAQREVDTVMKGRSL